MTNKKKELGSRVTCSECGEKFHTTEPHHYTKNCKGKRNAK